MDLMVRCSNLKQWEGPIVYMGTEFTWACVAAWV